MEKNFELPCGLSTELMAFCSWNTSYQTLIPKLLKNTKYLYEFCEKAFSKDSDWCEKHSIFSKKLITQVERESQLIDKQSLNRNSISYITTLVKIKEMIFFKKLENSKEINETDIPYLIDILKTAKVSQSTETFQRGLSILQSWCSFKIIEEKKSSFFTFVIKKLSKNLESELNTALQFKDVFPIQIRFIIHEVSLEKLHRFLDNFKTHITHLDLKSLDPEISSKKLNNIINKLPELKKLEIEHSLFTKITDTLINHSKLKELIITDIQGDNFNFTLFKNITSLKIRCISEAQLKSVIIDNPQLESLTISDMLNFENIEILGEESALKKIDLTCSQFHNCSVSIPFSKLKNLEYLDLSYTNLSFISSDIQNSNKLKILKLIECLELQDIPQIENLEFLQQIFLEDSLKLSAQSQQNILNYFKKALTNIEANQMVSSERYQLLTQSFLSCLKELRISLDDQLVERAEEILTLTEHNEDDLKSPFRIYNFLVKEVPNEPLVNFIPKKSTITDKEAIWKDQQASWNLNEIRAMSSFTSYTIDKLPQGINYNTLKNLTNALAYHLFNCLDANDYKLFERLIVEKYVIKKESLLLLLNNFMRSHYIFYLGIPPSSPHSLISASQYQLLSIIAAINAQFKIDRSNFELLKPAPKEKTSPENIAEPTSEDINEITEEINTEDTVEDAAEPLTEGTNNESAPELTVEEIIQQLNLFPFELMLLSLLTTVRDCETGMNEGLVLLYNNYLAQGLVKGEQQSQDKIQQLKNEVVSLLQSEMFNVFSSRPFLISLVGDDGLKQSSHFTNFLINRNYRQVGFKHPSKRIKFDPSTQVLSKKLLDLTPEKFVPRFFDEFTPEKAIAALCRLSGNILEPFVGILADFIMTKDENFAKNFNNYFIVDEEIIPQNLTPLGALYCLELCGFVTIDELNNK